MKLFKFRGGIHPDPQKEQTAKMAIEAMPLPDMLYIPLQQHIGAPAESSVSIGQYVHRGQLLALSQGMVSAPVHAPTSGTIEDITNFTAPHPSGLPVRTILLKPDKKDKWGDFVIPFDPFSLEPSEISTRVGEAGIVGMGGATFPSAIKLAQSKDYRLSTLIINGSECEPFLSCDDRLMQEHSEEVIDGIRLMAHALEVRNVYVAVENNKPRAFSVLRHAARGLKNFTIVQVPTLYPMGSEKQLIKTITGLETPAGKRAADIGIVMHNIATAHAVHNAIRRGRPLVSRIVTIAGSAVKRPGNLDVRVGTLVSDLLRSRGLVEEPGKIIMGGPMMGNPLPHSNVPVTKGCNGIIALAHEDASPKSSQACIRCGQCVEVCPIGLMPLEMAARIRSLNNSAAVDIGLLDCISCGSCSFICPSSIPLVQYFNHAKGELRKQGEAKRKSEYTRKLAEEKLARDEAAKQAKAAAAAKRKAERAAKEAAKLAQQNENSI